MANYERKILIPYLQNVCSMEMACMRIRRNIQHYEGQIKKTNQSIEKCMIEPKKPRQKDFCSSSIGIWVSGTLLAALFFITGTGMSGMSLIPGLIVYSIPLLVTCFLAASTSALVADYRDGKKNYEAALRMYEQEARNYQINQQKLPQYKQQLAAQQKLLDVQKSQLTRARSTLQGLYNVNIIPNRYRNIHVAYYLYDYFASTRETDLDKIVQTMLLDEIIQRLNKIIAQNEEIILNQRMQMAMQEQQNKMIAENHRQEMKRLARMEQNQERQMDYLQMIDRNQEVTNFFLAADFLSKRR